jgi:hypothetical protein
MQARANAFGVVTGACSLGQKNIRLRRVGFLGISVVRHRRLLAALF